MDQIKEYFNANPEILRNPKLYNYQGDTLLNFPVSEGYTEIASYLLEMGFSPNDKNLKSHETSLNRACHRSRFEIVKLLVRYGAEINFRDKNDLSPLLISIYRRKWQIAEYLISKGATLDYKCKNMAVLNQLNEILTPERLLYLENLSRRLYIYIYIFSIGWTRLRGHINLYDKRDTISVSKLPLLLELNENLYRLTIGYLVEDSYLNY